MQRSFRSNRGFTLIEVMVALTIMALITGIAFAGMSISLESWRRGTAKIQDLDRRFSVERLIQRQISLATPTAFLGGDHQLQFTSTYSLVNGSGTPVAVQYSFDSGNLLYSETSDPAVPGTAQSLGAFPKISFRYLAKDAQGRSIWENEWMGESLPVFVQVQFDRDVLNIPMVNRR